jgi:hypothetical protein
LGPQYRDELAEASARFAYHLYRLGRFSHASRIAREARKIGSPAYSFYSPVMRLLTRFIAQEGAEFVQGLRHVARRARSTAPI